MRTFCSRSIHRVSSNGNTMVKKCIQWHLLCGGCDEAHFQSLKLIKKLKAVLGSYLARCGNSGCKFSYVHKVFGQVVLGRHQQDNSQATSIFHLILVYLYRKILSYTIYLAAKLRILLGTRSSFLRQSYLRSRHITSRALFTWSRHNCSESPLREPGIC